MGEQEKIQQLTHDVAKWKNRALEAAAEACKMCPKQDFDGSCEDPECRIRKIRTEAAE